MLHQLFGLGLYKKFSNIPPTAMISYNIPESSGLPDTPARIRDNLHRLSDDLPPHAFYESAQDVFSPFSVS